MNSEYTLECRSGFDLYPCNMKKIHVLKAGCFSVVQEVSLGDFTFVCNNIFYFTKKEGGGGRGFLCFRGRKKITVKLHFISGCWHAAHGFGGPDGSVQYGGQGLL